jgi:hypothetical protein
MKHLAVIASLIVCACADPRTPEHAVPKSIISEHVRAFNAGDVEAMTKMQHPDIEWLSVSGTKLSVEVSGRDALSKNMTEYFKSPTKATGQLRGWSMNMPYVSVTETATWTRKDGSEASQSSLTVYELDNNLIRRVWYYPAVEN